VKMTKTTLETSENDENYTRNECGGEFTRSECSFTVTLGESLH
jgi:hypothetical protein